MGVNMRVRADGTQGRSSGGGSLLCPQEETGTHESLHRTVMRRAIKPVQRMRAGQTAFVRRVSDRGSRLSVQPNAGVLLRTLQLNAVAQRPLPNPSAFVSSNGQLDSSGWAGLP